MKKNSSRLILASASPRRRKLLKEAGYSFQIMKSHVKESVSKGKSPKWVVRNLARQKALSVSRRFPKDIVLGADTLVSLRGKIIGKPKNLKDAKKILHKLAGRWQRVYTGVAVSVKGGRKVHIGHEVSLVKMKLMTEKQINGVAHRHLDKAGAYAIQSKKDKFVDTLRGDFNNVVGLPVKTVKKILGRLGVRRRRRGSR